LISPPLIISAHNSATALAGATGVGTAQIESLIASIEQAWTTFTLESSQFSAADQIDSALRSALYFARAANALALEGRNSNSVRNRLQHAASKLGQARALVSSSASAVSSAGKFAHAPSANPPSVIGTVVAMSSASFAPRMALSSAGTVVGDPNRSPLAAASANAEQLATGMLPFELAGASVTISGRAASLLYVSPSSITFSVPASVPSGEVEVIVTSQEGYVSRGTLIVAAIAPGLFTEGRGISEGVTMNNWGTSEGGFAVTSPQTPGLDKRTRLSLFATGLSRAANTNTSNDIMIDGVRRPNLAESVRLEARVVRDGSIYYLPVEFAGALDYVAGVDQVNVVLARALRGAGDVELTLIVVGQRSNVALINLR
jgi:uncharacterized protein (TIGR03437 family)